MHSCDLNLAMNDGERTPPTAVSATWIHKGSYEKNTFKYDPLCPTIQSIHLYYQKFHEASFPPNHCRLCKLHVWKIMILYESTNMQPFHVLFVNRTTTIHYLFNENQAQNRAFWEALCSPSLDDGDIELRAY